MKIALDDKSLFGNEAAEDEKENVFASYAVERPEVTTFLDSAAHIAIARAYKGEGKSALLRLVAMRLREQSDPPITISVTASSISPELDGTDSDKWVRGWKTNILRLAAREIGAGIALAFSDDAISLVEEAESNGFKSRSFVSAIVDRLKTSAIPLERTRKPTDNPERVLQRWAKEGSLVWFVIDDLDQNFENTPAYRVKVATFFTALRQIANFIPEFRFRTSVRPNVWSIVKREYEALSNVEQYITDLTWSLDDFHGLIAKRVEGYLRRSNQWDEYRKTSGTDKKSLIASVFVDPMPWGREKVRPPAIVLYTLARHRPRWLVELWKVSAAAAVKARREKINFDDIQKELEAFGKRRIEDSVAEFRSQCPELEELLVAFVSQPERFTTDELIKAIQNRVLQAVHPRIVGLLGTPSPREVAHFLFQIGFLTARRDLGNDEYEHLSYADNPTLLNARTNVDQGHSWEIHPVFRQALKLKNA
jgi:hypothetical protein